MSDQLPEANFMNFLSGLGSQALMQFGEIPNPISGEREANPPYAAYTVQLLRILRDKTEGNRTAEEDEYLARMLDDLGQRLERLTG